MSKKIMLVVAALAGLSLAAAAQSNTAPAAPAQQTEHRGKMEMHHRVMHRKEMHHKRVVRRKEMHHKRVMRRKEMHHKRVMRRKAMHHEMMKKADMPAAAPAAPGGSQQ